MSDKEGRLGLIGAAIAFIAKGAKLIKLFKVAKPVVLFVSMSISAISYAFWFGPWLSLLFVGLLLVHEMGHVAAMRMKGYGTPTPVFIPFLGAAIFAPKGMGRETEAFVGFGGPLLGTIGSFATFGLWFLLPNKESGFATILLVGSYLGLYLNLFNLIPISPLDGGRITQAAGMWFKYFGFLALAGFSLWFREPVVLYIWILVLYDLHIIPVRLRAILVSGAWLAMVGLMTLGYGDQPIWVNIVDCVVTAAFVLIAIGRSVSKIQDVEPDVRPELSPKQRTKWFFLCAGLTVFLTVVVVFEHGFLPVPH